MPHCTFTVFSPHEDGAWTGRIPELVSRADLGDRPEGTAAGVPAAMEARFVSGPVR